MIKRRGEKKESRHSRGERHSGAKKETGGQETGERCAHTLLKGDRQNGCLLGGEGDGGGGRRRDT